jgi:hypothetical protein
MTLVSYRGRAIYENSIVQPSGDSSAHGEKGLKRFGLRPTGDRARPSELSARLSGRFRAVNKRDRPHHQKVLISSLFSLSRSLETVTDGRRTVLGVLAALSTARVHEAARE